MARKKTSQQSQFAIYRNLLYYPNAPERLFFFGSLNVDNEKIKGTGNQQYRARARQIYGKGMQYLTSNTLTDPEGLLTRSSKDYMAKINVIKTYLETAIKTERTNELLYFSNIINEIKRKFQGKEIPQAINELINFFASINDSTDFDYEGYILYINKLLQDMENDKNTESLITYERKRLQEVVQATSDAAFMKAAHTNKDIALLTTKEQNILLWQAQQGLNAKYLSTSKISSSKKDLSILDKQINVIMDKIHPPAATVIAKFVSKILPEIFSSSEVRTEILNIIAKQGLTPEKRLHSVKDIIITHLIKWGSDHIVELLQETKDALPIAKIESDMMTDLQKNQMLYNFQIDNLPENLGRTKGLNFFNATNSSATFKRGKGLYESVKKFLLDLQTIDEKQITDEQKIIIKTLGIGKEDANSQLLNKIARLQKMQTYILKEFKQLEDKTQPLTIKLDQLEKIINSKKKQSNDSTTIQLTVKNGRVFFDGSEGSKQLIKLLKDNGYFKSKTISSQTLDSFLSSLKGQASTIFKNILDQQVVKKGQKELLKIFEEHLNKIEVNIRGSMIDELIAGLQLVQKSNGELELYFGGSQNNKDDFIIITVDPGIKELTQALTLQCDNILKRSLVKPIQELYSQKEKFAKTFQRQFVEDMQKLKVKSSGYHDYQTKAKKFFEQYKTHIDNMNKAYANFQKAITKTKKIRDLFNKAQDQRTKEQQEIIKIIEEIKEKISNTIYRSDTMKTYTEYQNKIGFLGGSIGTNLHEQLGSINQLFTEMGIGLNENEITLLESLIINTSYYSIIGKKYKGVIERYLSSIAAFALFDEGGAEIELLQDQIKGKVDKTSPKILHLYRLNSIYFPGSYILQQTLKGVLELGKVMTINTHGARITINNPVNYSIIPNRPWSMGQTINTRPWQEVSEYAQNNVQLQITFLAGMIQILTNLESRMQNIVLPA